MDKLINIRSIEIGDNFIAWSTKTMGQREYQQLRRTVWPTAALSASFPSLRYQFDVQFNKIRQMLGMEPSYEEDVLHIKRQLEVMASIKEGKGSPISTRPTPSVSTQSTRSSSPSTQVDASATPTSKSTSSDQANSSADERQEPKTLIPKIPSLGGESKPEPVSFFLFMINFRKSSKPFALEAPRGTLLLSGLVEVIGAKGRATIDVVAAYNPTSNQFEIVSPTIRRIQPKSQAPKG